MYVKKMCFIIFSMLLSSSLFLCTIFATATDEKKIYRVGYYELYNPIQFTNAEQKSSGIAIDILREIGEKNDFQFSFYPISETTDIQFIKELDINIANTNNILNIHDTVLPALQYYEEILLLFGSAHIAEQDIFLTDNISIGIMDYYQFDESLILNFFPNAEITYFYNKYEIQTALHQNQIDFTFLNNAMIEELEVTNYQYRFKQYPLELNIPFYLLFSEHISQEEIDLFEKSLNELDQSITTYFTLDNNIDPTHALSFMNEINLYDYFHMAQQFSYLMLGLVVLLVVMGLFYKKYLNDMMFYDKITGFLTEYKFKIEVAKLLKKAKDHQYSLIAIDIDNFQYINEVYGFEIGNEILKLFAEYLKKQYPSTKLFSRIHSDNFFLFVENEGADIHFDDTFTNENFDDVLGEYYNLHTSKGVFLLHDVKQSFSSMIGCVNIAKQYGKATYGNTSVVFTSLMNKKRETQNKILSTMEQALINREFEVYYQSKVDLKTKKIIGAEALIRWIVRDGSPIFPDEFIPLFEKNRYILKLDLYIFDAVCQFISKNKEALGDIVLSVNLSTISILQDDLTQNLMDIMNRYQIDTKLLEIEITESAFVDNLEQVTNQVSKLRQLGFRIALDDFGSGISSLNQLKNIELDVIKLDKTFISGSLTKQKGLIIIENVIILAKKLQLKIVAEGVETEEESKALEKLGCHIAQGYLYSRPIPKEEFLNFIRKFSA